MNGLFKQWKKMQTHFKFKKMNLQIDFILRNIV